MNEIAVSHAIEKDPKRLAETILALMASPRFAKLPWMYGDRNLLYNNEYPNRTLARLLVNNIGTILNALDPSEDPLTKEYGPQLRYELPPFRESGSKNPSR